MRPFFLALLLLVISSSAFAPADINKGLVAHFTFNGCDAKDDSGHNNKGELKGNVHCWCGVEDNGLLLDGRDAHIVFSGEINHVFTTSDFSLSFFIKPEKKTTFPQSIISKREQCNDEHILDIMLDYSFQQIVTDFKESEAKFYRDLKLDLVEKTWFHYALVREGTYARVYINGELVVESKRCSGIDLSNEAPLSIGNSPCVVGGRAERFQGVVDELRVYDRALNADEIMLIYEQTPIENAQMDCYS